MLWLRHAPHAPQRSHQDPSKPSPVTSEGIHKRFLARPQDSLHPPCTLPAPSLHPPRICKLVAGPFAFLAKMRVWCSKACYGSDMPPHAPQRSHQDPSKPSPMTSEGLQKRLLGPGTPPKKTPNPLQPIPKASLHPPRTLLAPSSHPPCSLLAPSSQPPRSFPALLFGRRTLFGSPLAPSPQNGRKGSL